MGLDTEIVKKLLEPSHFPEHDAIIRITNAGEKITKLEIERVKLIHERDLAIHNAIVNHNITQIAIADALGISKQRVQQIIRKMVILELTTPPPKTEYELELERYAAELARDLDQPQTSEL